MPSPLEPVIRVPMELDPLGLPFPKCAFVPGQNAMIVQSGGEPSGMVAWTLRNAPSLALGLLLIVTLLWLWIVGRAWRRPRQRGRIYCRRCNYELTSPLVAQIGRRAIQVENGAKCPECGTELAVRRPVWGRTRLMRVVPVTAVAAPMSVLCVLVLFLTLERYSGPPAQLWPGSWVLSVAPRLAFQRVSVGPEWVFRFDRIELEGRGRRRKLAEVVAWYTEDPGVHVSCDGRWIITATSDGWNHPRYIARIDTSRGAMDRTVQLHGHVQAIVGWSDDGQHVLVSVEDSSSPLDEPSATLFAVHVVSLRLRTVASVRWPASIDATGTRHWPFLRFSVLDWPRDQADPDWVAVALDYCAGATGPAISAKGKVIVCRGGHKREWPISTPCGGWYLISLNGAGRALAVDGGSFGGAASRTEVDLESGEVDQGGASINTVDYTEDRRYRLNSQIPARATLTRSADGALLATVRIPQPDASQWGTAGRPVVSADERWLAHIALEPAVTVTPGTTPMSGWRPVMYVWDLKQTRVDQPGSLP